MMALTTYSEYLSFFILDVSISIVHYEFDQSNTIQLVSIKLKHRFTRGTFFKVVAYIGMHATPLLHGVKLFAASENAVPLIILAREEIRPIHDAN